MRRSLLVAWLAFGCTGDATEDKDAGPTDGDADTDADTDSDTDADTDSDADADLADADDDGSPDDLDCDDVDPTVYPGAPDLCGDGKVTNCDRTSDDGLVTLDGTTGFDDLGDALAAAGSGSELLLCPGVHDGPVTAASPVRLVAYDEALGATIDGHGTGAALTVVGGTELVGLTITGGSAPQGGGIALTTAGDLTLERVTVTGNRARSGGGIALFADSAAYLVDTEIVDNVADEVGGGVFAPGATVDLQGTSRIAGNSAAFAGGGVMLADGQVSGGVIEDNELTSFGSITVSGTSVTYDFPYQGGGISSIGQSTVIGTEIRSNRSMYGAGVTDTDGDLSLIDVSIHDNAADTNGGAGGGIATIGGVIRMEGATEVFANQAAIGAGGLASIGEVSGGTIRDNTATLLGGGLVVASSTADGCAITGNRAPIAAGGVLVVQGATLTGLTVTGNATDGTGGGIGESEDLFYGPAAIAIDGGTITGNTAAEGGGLYALSPVSATDAVFDGNTADRGAGLSVQQAELTGGAVKANVATDAGGGVWVDQSLAVTGVDFGVDAADNAPDDVHAGAAGFAGYGAAATFACDATGCTP